jgi:hypothetical protein
VSERYELEGRYDKAWKLCRYLQGIGVDHEQAAGWDDDQWSTVAGMAGVNPPSAKTQGLVIGLLTPTVTA